MSSTNSPFYKNSLTWFLMNPFYEKLFYSIIFKSCRNFLSGGMVHSCCYINGKRKLKERDMRNIK